MSRPIEPTHYSIKVTIAYRDEQSSSFVGSLTRPTDAIKCGDTVEIKANEQYHTVEVTHRHHVPDPVLIELSTKSLFVSSKTDYDQITEDFETDQNWIGLPD